MLPAVLSNMPFSCLECRRALHRFGISKASDAPAERADLLELMLQKQFLFLPVHANQYTQCTAFIAVLMQVLILVLVVLDPYSLSVS